MNTKITKNEWWKLKISQIYECILFWNWILQKNLPCCRFLTMEIKHFSAFIKYFLWIQLLATHPIRVIQVVVIKKCVNANILQVIIHQGLVWMNIKLVSRIIGIDSIPFKTIFIFRIFSIATGVFNLVVLRFLDGFTVEEEVRSYFVNRRNAEALAVFSVSQSGSEGVEEQSSVQILSGPTCQLVKAIEVLGVVEKDEQSFCFGDVVQIKLGKYWFTCQMTFVVLNEEFLGYLLFLESFLVQYVGILKNFCYLVIVKELFQIEFGSSLYYRFVMAWLVYVVKKLKNLLVFC